MGKLKTKLATLEGLDEQTKSLYVQKDEYFVLNTESVDGWSLENVSGLRSALERERAESKAAREKLALYGELDPEAAKNAVTKYEEFKNWKPDQNVEKVWSERADEIKKKHDREKAEILKERVALEEEIRAQHVDSALAQIVSGKASYKLLLPIVKQHAIVERDAAGRRVVRVKNPETGNPRISQRSGNQENLMGLEEYVMDVLRNDQDYADAFKPSKGGSGASNDSAGESGGAGFKVVSRGDANNVDLAEVARGRVKVGD
ncbi:hypothetical protein [Caudoviricetes sp.]|nr:hypothetical protein [Caudoviricetes sp.]UOF82748.1 hypothetical protein [Caudoviricetes sp.]